MEKDKIAEIFSRFYNKEPVPKTELYYINKFTLVLAVLLSAQSTDAAVNKATKRLFAIADSPQKILKLCGLKPAESASSNLENKEELKNLEALKAYIRNIGLYNNKAKNIVLLSQKLIADNIHDIPNDFDYLLSLPGIGRKSANVILNILFNKMLIGVDTHVLRVSNRIGLVKAKNPLQTEKAFIEMFKSNIILKEFLPYIHHWLVLHGRYICKAIKPKCPECLIKDLCEYPLKTKH